MAQYSFIWPTSATPTGDQVTDYTAAHAADMFETLAGASAPEGVIPNMGNSNPTDLMELAGTVTGLNAVQINTGRAVVDGRAYINSSPVSVNIPSAVGAGNTRIDRIVLRAVSTGTDVSIVRVAGVDAGSPTAPALTQNRRVTYDLPLYRATVNTAGTVTLVDERIWASGGIVDNATLEKATSILRVKDLGITAAKLAANAVTAGKIADGAVNTTAKLANDIVDDTKVGNRVPALIRRQGGHSTDWSVPGTTTYSPNAVRIQVGAVTTPQGGGIINGSVTFPIPFSSPPLVFLQWYNLVLLSSWSRGVVTTTGFEYQTNSSYANGYGIFEWIAIGPE